MTCVRGNEGNSRCKRWAVLALGLQHFHGEPGLDGLNWPTYLHRAVNKRLNGASPCDQALRQYVEAPKRSGEKRLVRYIGSINGYKLLPTPKFPESS